MMRVFLFVSCAVGVFCNGRLFLSVWEQIQRWDVDPVMKSIDYSPAYGFLGAFFILTLVCFFGMIVALRGKF